MSHTQIQSSDTMPIRCSYSYTLMDPNIPKRTPKPDPLVTIFSEISSTKIINETILILLTIIKNVMTSVSTIEHTTMFSMPAKASY